MGGRDVHVTEVSNPDNLLPDQTQLGESTHGAELRLVVLELAELLVSNLEEGLNLLVGAHAVVLLQHIEELSLGGLVVVEAELCAEQDVELVLGLLEEVVLACHPLELIALDLGLPGGDLLLQSDDLVVQLPDDECNLLKALDKLAVLLYNLLALNGEVIGLEAGNELGESSEVGLDGGAVVGDLGHLGVQSGHGST